MRMFDNITSFLPLIVTLPFAMKTVAAYSVAQQAAPQPEPSQLLAQALFVFGASLLGWAARRLNNSWQNRRDTKKVVKTRLTADERIRSIEAQHSLEMRYQTQRLNRVQNDLDAANLLILELEDQKDVLNKANQDLIMQLREQRSQEELVKIVLKAILALPK